MKNIALFLLLACVFVVALPVRAENLNGVVEQSANPFRLRRPVEEQDGAAQSNTTQTEKVQAADCDLEMRAFLSRGCACHRWPVRHGPGHVAPNLSNAGYSEDGRCMGDLEEGTGKKVFMEFKDYSLYCKPAWVAWIARMRDAVLPGWVKDNNDTGEVCMDFTIAGGRITKMSGCTTCGSSPRSPESYGRLGLEYSGLNEDRSCDSKAVLAYKEMRDVVDAGRVPAPPDAAVPEVHVITWWQYRNQPRWECGF